MKRKITACFPVSRERKKICVMYNKYSQALDQTAWEWYRICVMRFFKEKVKQASVWVVRVLLTVSEKSYWLEFFTALCFSDCISMLEKGTLGRKAKLRAVVARRLIHSLHLDQISQDKCLVLQTKWGFHAGNLLTCFFCNSFPDDYEN